MLSLDSVLKLARPLGREALFAQVQDPPKIAGLGLSFINVAKEVRTQRQNASSAANTKTNICWKRPAAASLFTTTTTTAGSIFSWSTARAWKAFAAGQEPTSHLFKNNRDGTFTDVTAKAGVGHAGWGQGVCVGDYDNDGYEDLFVTYFGQECSLSQQRRRHVHRRERKSRCRRQAASAGTRAARFVDYDRDGKLDLFVANYIDLDLATAPVPESGPCLYKGVHGGLRSAGAEGRQKHPVSQQWRRNLHRCFAKQPACLKPTGPTVSAC